MEVARRRGGSPWRDRVDLRVLPIEDISRLAGEGPYDGVLSNFAGLNCVANLASVARDLARLVRPGGCAVLCLFGRCCLWELMGYGLRGDFPRAFRRLGREGVAAQLAPGHRVRVRYPSVRSVCRDFAPHFRRVSWKGVGVAVPPSYGEPWAARFPGLIRFAAWIDSWLGRLPGARALADHFVLVLKRVEV